MQHKTNQNKHRRLLSWLILGLFSTVFAEFLSGSSPLWYREWFGYVFVFPIYLTHTLFYLNVAYHTKRTSFRGLFLLGAMFGLYEGFLTRVLWFGYPIESQPVLGTFLDVAWFEYVTLVFFWHPVTAFLMPILLFTLIRKQTLFRWSSKRLILGFSALGFFGGVFLHVSLASSMALILESFIVTLGLLIIASWMIKKAELSLEDAIISPRTTVLLGGVLILGMYIPYWLFYDTFSPRPSWLGLITYGLSWGGLCWLYLRSPQTPWKLRPIDLFKVHWLYVSLFGALLTGILGFYFLNFLLPSVSILFYVSLPILGVVTFIIALKKHRLPQPIKNPSPIEKMG